jgi:histidinol dehydrogenase
MQQPIKNNKQQTAVEWIMNELTKLGSGAVRTFGNLFEQAKELEKQQIKDACQQRFYDGLYMAKTKKSKFKSAEQYYNETYNN